MDFRRHVFAWGGLRAALVALLLSMDGAALAQDPPKVAYPDYPSETPEKFTPVTDRHDYTWRDVMIAMRDGVKLHTVILVPKGAAHAGMLLTRTPYNAKDLVSHSQSGHLGPMLEGYDNATDVIIEDGYIRVMQDVRGKYGSEGDYVMNRPVHGPQNPTPVDDATDTFDTIDWLVKNVPESNGKVGTLGISYDGFEPLMALVNPHPALKVSVPMNPMVDGWMGDDWYHNGAFRQQNLAYIYEQVASRDNTVKWWTNYHDDYDLFMQNGSGRRVGASLRHGTARFLEQVARASRLRCLLERSSRGQAARRAAVAGAGDAGAQPVGSGGQLRRAGGVFSHQAQGYARRHGEAGHGSLVSRPGNWRGQRPRRNPLRQRYRQVFS